MITTSLVYFLPSLYGVAVGEWHMAFLCAITCVGSSIYHRNREAVYFNLDNVFATSLLVTYVWSLYIAYGIYEAYFIFGLVGIPVAIFLLIYCGMPAEISIGKQILDAPFCCVRSDRPLYNSVHALWHIASGCGPLLSVWMFSNYATDYAQDHNSTDISGSRLGLGLGSVSVFGSVSGSGLGSVSGSGLGTGSMSGAGSVAGSGSGRMIMGSTECWDSMGWLPVVPTTALLCGVLLNLTGNYFRVMPMD